MDIGVGAFVFSSGLTSKYAKPSTPSVAATTLDYVHLLPIFILGLFRLLTVKGIEYQEHASEYGVHWNFYFTMGAVQVAYITLKSMGKALTSISSALVLITRTSDSLRLNDMCAFIHLFIHYRSIVYQIALSFSGLSEYIITAPRINLYSQNREGIWSCLGKTRLIRWMSNMNCDSRLLRISVVVFIGHQNWISFGVYTHYGNQRSMSIVFQVYNSPVAHHRSGTALHCPSFTSNG